MKCALTVDPLPRRSRRLVPDEKQQRSLSRSMEAYGRSLCADPHALDALADGLRALLAKQLGAMVRRGRRDDTVALLRETLGDRRSAYLRSPPPAACRDPTGGTLRRKAARSSR